MVWDLVRHEITRPHVAYAVTGFALILFGTLSLFLKEKLYIGEATSATIYGLIVGPHCLNWFSPTTWGNSDYITIEISRIVLIVQIFAVAVELPKKYMLRHWWSIFVLLVPVMSFGWVVSSVFIWKLVPTLRWIHALCIAGCVTATDPVLAAAVVGKGKFARRVPGHLRNILSAESGCNDGMAFPFVIMAIDILNDEKNPPEVAKNFLAIGILYSCVLGVLIGVVIGYLARHLIKFAEKKNLIDRESFLVYYFCVAIFCAGVGTLCGVDDLLVAFAAGAAFSWDGWFARETEESHVSNVIDSLLNTAFFVYFGAIVPWPDFNNYEIGIKAWKLVCLAIIILVVRRIPIILALKPIIPDIHTWREAFFCGHFGPIGVGAVFMALLARAQLETHSETPSPDLLPVDHPQYILVRTIWPVSCFLIVASIIVHGSSIAVFTLGKRINNMAITLTYTTGGNEPSWMSRLPRKNTDNGGLLQLRRMETEEPYSQRVVHRKVLKKGNKKNKQKNKDKLEKNQNQNKFTRKQQEESNPNAEIVHGDPKHEIIILTFDADFEHAGHVSKHVEVPASKFEDLKLEDIKAYKEGDQIAIEDKEGNGIAQIDVDSDCGDIVGQPHLGLRAIDDVVDPEQRAQEHGDYDEGDGSAPTNTSDGKGDDSAAVTDDETNTDVETKRKSHQRPRRRLSRIGSRHKRGQHAYAYQIDDHVVVENNDGDVLRKYKYIKRGDAPKRPFWQRVKHLLPHFADISNEKQPHDKDFKDYENSPQNMLVPDADSGKPEHTMSPEEEDYLRKKLDEKVQSGEISSDGTILDTKELPGLDAEVKTDAEADDDNYNDNITEDDNISEDEYVTENNDEDDDAEPETAVERRRRLAALGIHEDENDAGAEADTEHEEGDGNDTPEGDNEPRITFKLPQPPR